MASFPHYDKGNWDALCDSCGRKFKASQLRLRWDGLRVCKEDFEIRHPQDFVRAKVDIQATPWTRPESSDTFAYFACTTRTSIPGYAQPGCAIPGNILIPDPVPPSTFTL